MPVDKTTHDLKKFDCGKPGMNFFLSRNAVKHRKLGLSSTWVLTEEGEPFEGRKLHVAAYYTLCSASVSREEIPAQRSLPAYPVPVVMLARLAVDKQLQGKRLGEKSLVYALRHAVQLCDGGLPAFGLILDVLDEQALGFYQQFEMFRPFEDDPMRLFVSMNSLRQL